MHLTRFSSVIPARAVRRTAGFLAAVAVAAVVACSDPFKPTASTAVRTDTFVVYSITGTPPELPTAFNVVFFTTTRIDPTYGFDFGFDIDSDGKARLIPVKQMGGPLTQTRQTGFLRITTPWESVVRAPNSGYNFDSTMTLGAGEATLIQVRADQCSSQLTNLIYAKLQIFGIDVARRAIGFQVTYDPNCGFRSFLPGVPKD